MCPSFAEWPKWNRVVSLRTSMPRGCYSCDLDWFENDKDCHWVYLTEDEDRELMAIGKSKGLVIYKRGKDRFIYAPMCGRCLAKHLTGIRVYRNQPKKLEEIMSNTITQAVLEYIGDQVAHGKLHGGYLDGDGEEAPAKRTKVTSTPGA